MIRYTLVALLTLSAGFIKAQNDDPVILLDGIPVSIEEGIRTDDFRDSSMTKGCTLSISFSDTTIVIKKYQLARGKRAITDLIDVENPKSINLRPVQFQSYEGDELIFYTEKDIILLEIPIR